MNFYLGKSDLKVNFQDYNVIFTDDLSEFLYQRRMDLDIDLSWLFALDPYDLDYVPAEKMNTVRQSCLALLDMHVLELFPFPKYAIESVTLTADLAEKAASAGLGIISLGD